MENVKENSEKPITEDSSVTQIGESPSSVSSFPGQEAPTVIVTRRRDDLMERKEKFSLRAWIENSKYWAVAIAFVGLALTYFAAKTIYEIIVPPQQFESSFLAGDGQPGPPPPPPSSTQAEQQETEPVPTAMPQITTAEVFVSNVVSADTFSMPIPQMNVQTDTKSVEKSAQTISNTMSNTDLLLRKSAVKGMVGSWSKDGQPGSIGTGTGVQAEFVCYLAKYEGGDWGSSVFDPDEKPVDGSLAKKGEKAPAGDGKATEAGEIAQGSLPNLLRYISEWTKGRVKAETMPRPLDLGNEEIFKTKPPFIYMTGHRNFTLSDTEVKNMRRYLMEGGAIWGDNGLAGRNSMFDIAFRREMKRVLPDENIKFEKLPYTHEIYSTYFRLPGPPAGMNYVQEPIEVMRIDGIPSIVYTPNNYSDMMRMVFEEIGTKDQKPRLLPGVKGNRGIDAKGNVVYGTPLDLYSHSSGRGANPFYRNFEPDSCKEVYRMGMNVIVYLLTRYEAYIR